MGSLLIIELSLCTQLKCYCKNLCSLDGTRLISVFNVYVQQKKKEIGNR